MLMRGDVTKLTPEQQALIDAETPQNLKDEQTMAGFEGQPDNGAAAAEEPLSLEDMRAQTEAALGTRPQARAPAGPPDAPERAEIDKILPPVSREEEAIAAVRNTSLLQPKGEEPEEAEKSLEAAHDAGILKPQVLLVLGRINAGRGRYEKALRYFEEAKALGPESFPDQDMIDFLKQKVETGSRG